MATESPIKMDPEVKAEWVQALRSGEYKQARGYLRRTLDRGAKEINTQPQGFCCLGVLTDLYCKQTGKGSWGPPNAFGSHFTSASSSSRTDLTQEVSYWSGLDNGEVESELARKNDSGSYDFNQIADWIEEKL